MSGYRFLVNSASSSWDTSQVRVSTVIYPFVYMFRHVYSTIGIGSLLTALQAPTSLQVRVAVRWSVTHLELLWGDLWLTWRCCEVKCDSPGGAVRWSVTHLELLWGEVWLTWSCCEVQCDSPGAAVRWSVSADGAVSSSFRLCPAGRADCRLPRCSGWAPRRDLECVGLI